MWLDFKKRKDCFYELEDTASKDKLNEEYNKIDYQTISKSYRNT